MSDTLTLFNLDDLTPPPAEPVIERYVVVVNTDAGRSFYRRNKRTSDYDSFDDFVDIDTDKPIPTKGIKLPTLYRTPQGARQRVKDLFNRHKRGGDGLNCWVQVWTRKASDNRWHPKQGAFK
jgi:hypothetical protein